MPPQESVIPTTCDHCGDHFNTSRQSPRRYCSIACEEGRAPLPIDDPSSDGYHLHLRGEPEALVGKMLVAHGLRLVDYSPDWCRSPEDWTAGSVVSVDEENETYVRKDGVIVGNVIDMEDDEYVIELKRTDVNGETETIIKQHPTSTVVNMIRKDRWWAEK